LQDLTPLTFTAFYNRRHCRVGHLYQGRFKAILVEADSYLLELSRYVHLNPVRVGAMGGKEARGRLRWIFRTIRPLVPVDSGHLFRVIAAGVGAKRRWSYFH
jgi:hypothetical protein